MGTEIGISMTASLINGEADLTKTGLSGWRDLVMKGYGFRGDNDFARMQVEMEYASGEGLLFLATLDRRVIASLVLKESDIFNIPKSYGIHGVVLLPDYRGLGLGKRLFLEATHRLEPHIMAGSTKTPAEVMAQASGTRTGNMRTFYGYYEVTSPDSSGPTEIHSGILGKYYFKKHILPGDFVLKPPDILLPDLPDLSGYPLYIVEAFGPVLEKQIQIGDSLTAALPAISIHRSLLTGSETEP